MSKPVATIALPTYDSSDILWLQLESLCRQETQYPWELIVCEEDSPKYAGIKYFNEYHTRLTKAGCVNFKYIHLDEYTPLSKKWVIIAQEAQGESFLLTASDDYSDSKRIEYSHPMILKGYDWFDIEQALFIFLDNFMTATFKAFPKRTGVGITIRTEDVRNIKCDKLISKSVDTWLRDSIQPKNAFRYKYLSKNVYTDGCNIISKYRKQLYTRKRMVKPFIRPTQLITDIVPSDVLEKLKQQFHKGYLNR